jgi:hypothetical protein
MNICPHSTPPSTRDPVYPMTCPSPRVVLMGGMSTQSIDMASGSALISMHHQCIPVYRLDLCGSARVPAPGASGRAAVTQRGQWLMNHGHGELAHVHAVV